jgi:DNA-directed RNA polymerase subunit L
MQVSVVEQEKGKMKVELKGSSKSFAHLISSEVWETEKGEAAALQEHPFLKEPELLVKSSNPKKSMEKAASSIEKKCDELKEAYKRSK